MEGDSEGNAYSPDSPLPDYVLSWGPTLRRPTEFPDEYDRRIDKSAIFVFPEDPKTGAPGLVYVVEKRCDRCKKRLQMCTRGRPCASCETKGPCTVSTPGFVRLPGPKQLKGKARSAAAAKLSLAEGKGLPSSSGRVLRPSSVKLRSASAPIPPASQPAPRASLSARNADDMTSLQLPKLVNKGKVLGRRTVSLQKTRVKTQQRVADIQQGRKASVRQKLVLKKTKQKLDAVSPWTVTFPPVVLPADAAAIFPKTLPPSLPHIWANSKEDLFKVLPQLSHDTNGVAWVSSETPTLILDGQTWPEDIWNGHQLMVTMVRQHVSQAVSISTQRVVQDVDDPDVEMTLVDELPEASRQETTDTYSSLPLHLYPSASNHSLDTVLWNPEYIPLAPFMIQMLQRDPLSHKPSDVLQPSKRTEDDGGHDDDHCFAQEPFRNANNDPDPDIPSMPFIPTLDPSPYPSPSLTGAFNPTSYTELSVARFNVPGPDCPASLSLSYPSISMSDTILDTSGLCYPDTNLLDQQRNDKNTDESLPHPVPIEVQNLLEAYAQNIPVRIIMTRDCSLFPFSLPPEYGCFFLGFFRIRIKPELTVGSSPLGAHVTRACWQFTFDWIPSGDDLDKPSSVPWWFSPFSDNLDNESEKESAVLYPYTLLPDYFTSPSTPDGAPLPLVSASALTRKGWHCSGCGKLNIQRFLCVQNCDKCQKDNGMSPIHVVHVRNTYNMAPISFPWNRYPTAYISSYSQADPTTGYTSFTYLVHGTAVNTGKVMHLFTGNEPSLQDEPSKVWMDLQKGDIPLKWQSVDMPLAAGPYYTYFIRPTKPTPCSDETPGLSSPLSNTSVWDDAPACIARARLLLQAILQDHWAGSFLVDEITVLAWLGVGNRKSPTPLPAKTRKVAILCLGADVELTLVPLNGFHSRAPDASTTHVEVQTLPTLDLPNSVEIDVEGYDPMDEDGDELIGAGLFQDAHSISVPSIKPVSVTSMPSKKDDVLFLTLVHGDLALLEGDDFNWTMRRTGMSMVLIAS